MIEFIGIAIVIGIAIGIFWVINKKSSEAPPPAIESDTPSKSPDAASAPTTSAEQEAHEDDSTSTEDADAGEEDAVPSAAPEDAEQLPSAQESQEQPPAEGVRLDEGAEEAALQDLKRQRRERKLKKLRSGLAKTRGGFVSRLSDLFRGKRDLSPELLEELEETLITSDVGTKTASWLVQLTQNALDKDELKDPDEVWAFLKQEIKTTLDIPAPTWNIKRDTPFTIMVVGVNGTGKTTTIGKLAAGFTENGYKVVLAAADTFRAAAVSQLEIWGRRTGSDVIKPAKEQADPSSVVFDAIETAKKSGADIVIADTAGRLHTQAPLMEELKKIKRVMGKAHDGAPHEIMLVLDATTGQNAIAQVKQFGEALDLSCIALTKLDGTAKGGVLIGVCHEHKIPVRYIGIGETKDSLREFDVDDFTDALFFNESDATDNG